MHIVSLSTTSAIRVFEPISSPTSTYIFLIVPETFDSMSSLSNSSSALSSALFAFFSAFSALVTLELRLSESIL